MCTCLQINVTPASTGIAETIQVDGVLVDTNYTYSFSAGGLNYTIFWDGELWSMWQVLPGDDEFVGSNTTLDCPIGEWTFDSHYFSEFSTAECGTLSEEANCFKLQVWQKQCNFGKEVAKYLRLLQFGTICCNELEELKNKRRALLILNCYDTRDISNNTTEYNALTYSQIKKLLEY
jgi:hypothetical protein